MGDFVDIAARLMSVSERRLEFVSANVSNSSTPGFKRQGAFQVAGSFNLAEPAGPGAELRLAPDLSPGGLKLTGNRFDLAIEGSGFFSLRGESGQVLSRAGQFQRDPDGRLVTVQGHALQAAGGGDIFITSANPEILEDGTVLEGGLPTGRIAVVNVDEAWLLSAQGGAVFTLPPDAGIAPETGGLVRQGMLEGSNVAMPAEMLSMMQAVRQAETGARLVQLYDTLMGRAISTFGQRG